MTMSQKREQQQSLLDRPTPDKSAPALIVLDYHDDDYYFCKCSIHLATRTCTSGFIGASHSRPRSHT